MDRLRLAVALPHLDVYGGVRRFVELGRVWAERGHYVTLAIPAAVHASDDQRAAIRRATARLPLPGRVAPIEEIQRERWDVLLSPDPKLFQSVRPPGALRVFYAVLEKAPGAGAAWRSADLVLANSTGMAAHLRRRGVGAVPAVGGVDISVFHPPGPDVRPARARDGKPAHALIYGRLSRKRKGTMAAARAVADASRRAGVSVELTLFDAPPRGATRPPERLPLAIPHRWVLDPTQSELVALYGDADIFVSAERRAGWCNTAAEAMACGAAVVCTRSGTQDFARHRETALVSRYPWAWTLSRHVETLLRDSALRTAIAGRGLERIRWFPWERTADVIEGAIRERIGGRS
ncbi:MAG TPA: glycosyltransferase [Candidatus Limnocylindrales bacterium]|nr:glycosyltransferase [Candidatus Limnocylindrales bacterium]